MNSSNENKQSVYTCSCSVQTADPKTVFVKNLHGDDFHSNERT